jgi:competence protein ComEA
MPFHKLLSPGVLFICLLPGPWGALGQEQQGPLPEGPGKAAVQRICSNCHEIETVIASRRTRIGWQQMVEDMASRGAEGSAEEMMAVVEYLTAGFGKVNVNAASVGDLVKALELPEKEAQAIVGYRQQHTKIKDFEELLKIPGVSAEKLHAKRGMVAFSL